MFFIFKATNSCFKLLSKFSNTDICSIAIRASSTKSLTIAFKAKLIITCFTNVQTIGAHRSSTFWARLCGRRITTKRTELLSSSYLNHSLTPEPLLHTIWCQWFAYNLSKQGGLDSTTKQYSIPSTNLL